MSTLNLSSRSEAGSPVRAGVDGWLRVLGPWAVFGLGVAELARRAAIKAGWVELGPIIPATPTSCILLILLGLALGLGPAHPAPWRRRTAWLPFLVACALVGLSAICLMTGTHTVWEAWFGPGLLPRNAGAPAYVSGQAIAMFTVTTAAFVGLETNARQRPVIRDVGLACAVLVELFALISAITYAAGNPPAGIDGWQRIPPPTMLGLALLNAALLAGPEATGRARRWFSGSEVASEYSREERFALRLGLAIAAAGILSGVVYLRHATAEVRAQALEQLSTNNDLKAEQVEQWRTERLSDARILMHAPLLYEVFQDGADSGRVQEAVTWLHEFLRSYGYRQLVLLNSNMAPFSVVGEAAGDEPGDYAAARDSLAREKRVVELPVGIDGAGRLTWDLLVPIRTPDDALPGAIVLRSNPTDRLGPILDRWPSEHATGQSVLWLREGHRAFALAGYRDRGAPAGVRPRPLAVVRSVDDMPPDSLGSRFLRGEIERGEGPDFSRVLILAAGKQLPDSNWFVTSRLDATEVYAPLRRSAFAIGGGIVGLLAATGVTASWLWRRKQDQNLRERLSAELEQRQLAARLGMVMRHAKDIILIVDMQMRIVDANHQAEESYGYRRDELLRLSLSDLRAPETLPDLAATFARSQQRGGAVFETVHRRKDGGIFPVEISSRIVELDETRQVLAMVRDVTERRRAEAALRESEERYRLIAENTSDVIWLVDLRDYRFTYVSPSTIRASGWRPEEIIGQPLGGFSTASSEVRAKIDAQVAAFNAGDSAMRSRTHEMEMRHKDGSLRHVEILATLLPGPDGRAAMLLGVNRDLTERRQAEAEQRQAREVLTSLERERKLSEMKSQFISVASHEFRTPLAAATATLDLLERHGSKLAEAKQSELRHRVQTSLGRLTAIMNDVLQLSRADSGRVKVQRQSADLRLFLRDILDEVAAGDAGQHAFEYRAPTGPQVVPYDSRILHHVISNLLANAVRYSPAGTTITLEFEPQPSQFSVTVRDQGIGIPEADRERVFEPFVRGSNVAGIGGTGLGLNIARRYTELMGGRIELLASDRGATFRVTVPHSSPPP